MMFCGKNYYGMQYQTEFPTIENEIFQALAKVGVVTQQHVDNKNEQVQCSNSNVALTTTVDTCGCHYFAICCVEF